MQFPFGSASTQESDLKLSFHGADRSVTGSCHLVECAGKRILIDCGLHQGSRELDEENAAPFGFDAAGIDYVLLTHAHLQVASGLHRSKTWVVALSSPRIGNQLGAAQFRAHWKLPRRRPAPYSPDRARGNPQSRNEPLSIALGV